MGYARQDREFLGGEVVTIGVVGRLLKAAGVKKVLTVDIHSKLALKELKISSENVSAMEVLVKYFKKLKMKDPLVVSPDMGGEERAKKFSRLLKTDFITLKKHRDRKTGNVNILSGKVDVKNRDIILVDDNLLIVENDKQKALLTETESKIVKCLFSKKRVSKNFLNIEVLNQRNDLESKTLETHLSRLRKKILELNKSIKIFSNKNKEIQIN